jgi:hypothetical protein
MVAGFAAGLIGSVHSTGCLLEHCWQLWDDCSAFMGSALTEIVRILQVRFVGAVYKSSGRAALRQTNRLTAILRYLLLNLLCMITGNGLVNFISTLSTFQTAIWYVPFVWAGTALYYVFNSEIILAVSLHCRNSPILAGLYYVAVLLNQRFASMNRQRLGYKQAAAT